eukprot:1557313-Pleurochrysis_carterae.AAC.1
MFERKLYLLPAVHTSTLVRPKVHHSQGLFFCLPICINYGFNASSQGQIVLGVTGVLPDVLFQELTAALLRPDAYLTCFLVF